MENTKPEAANESDVGTSPGASTPLIFISHDTRDAPVAEAFAKLISSVSCGMLKSFRSSDKSGSQGIEYGLEWYPQLMSKLDDSSGVVCLLTQRSLDRPWILYEAGVAKGKLDTPVYGIALGISLSQANSGPFAQFQNCDDDTESLANLVMQLLSRIPNSEPDRDAVLMQVESFVRKKTELLQDDEEADADAPDAVAKLFEEVKLIVQDLPSKVEGRLADADPMRRRRMRRFHPMMFVEELTMKSEKFMSPAVLLVIFGFFRDEFPWLYDLGLDYCRALRDSDLKRADLIREELVSICDLPRRNPMWKKMLMTSKDAHMFLHELPHLLERFDERFAMRRRKRMEDTD